jgi:hypothetical protein
MAAKRGSFAGTETDKVQALWLNRLAWLAGGTAAVGGSYLLGRKVVGELFTEPRFERTLEQSTIMQTGAWFADQFEMAFHPSGNKTVSDWFGDGTDEDRVLELLRLIPSREVFAECVKKYEILNPGRNFFTDLKTELTSIWGNSDYNKALEIINRLK